jgi:hypothetical protein
VLSSSGDSFGSGLGAQQANSQLLLNGAPIAVTGWSDTSIQFTEPADDKASGVAWANLPEAEPLVVSMTGQLSNSAALKVTRLSVVTIGARRNPRQAYGQCVARNRGIRRAG